jgi:hypothetical protein
MTAGVTRLSAATPVVRGPYTWEWGKTPYVEHWQRAATEAGRSRHNETLHLTRADVVRLLRSAVFSSLAGERDGKG